MCLLVNLSLGCAHSFAGESVAENDIVAQIETDKVTVDVKYTLAAGGKITSIMVGEGDTVKVGQPILEVEEGAAGAAPAAAPAAAAAAPEAAAPAPKAEAPKAEAPKAPAAPVRSGGCEVNPIPRCTGIKRQLSCCSAPILTIVVSRSVVLDASLGPRYHAASHSPLLACSAAHTDDLS